MRPPPRVTWRRRRGMRELDLIFERYLESGYDSLEAVGREAFERLLIHPDQEVFEWILGRSTAPDRDLAAIAACIRRTMPGREVDGDE